MGKLFQELDEMFATDVVDDDLMVIEDVSSDTTKRIKWSELQKRIVIENENIAEGAVTSESIDWATSREVLFSGGVGNGNPIPLSDDWRKFKTIIITASQNATGALQRATSITVDVETLMMGGGTPYMQLTANTGANNTLTHKIDVRLETSNGTAYAESTIVGGNTYYIRSIVGMWPE